MLYDFFLQNKSSSTLESGMRKFRPISIEYEYLHRLLFSHSENITGYFQTEKNNKLLGCHVMYCMLILIFERNMFKYQNMQQTENSTHWTFNVELITFVRPF